MTLLNEIAEETDTRLDKSQHLEKDGKWNHMPERREVDEI